ncbi:zinc finger MYM-type protein 5-like [Aphis craccivora]|uniref:Zinc finger MYM-type protein 5-like n=1 Tax=Aphis craccivora TaxID=307492 RepID=A0A6G0VZJ7_APHCR|nr:zinc finger MYM-type protein 5-like [Aphis craccivora]
MLLLMFFFSPQQYRLSAILFMLRCGNFQRNMRSRTENSKILDKINGHFSVETVTRNSLNNNLTKNYLFVSFDKIISMSSIIKCDCGKLSNSMNSHNWNKHINSCKIRMSKRTTCDIKSFYVGVQKKEN